MAGTNVIFNKPSVAELIHYNNSKRDFEWELCIIPTFHSTDDLQGNNIF